MEDFVPCSSNIEISLSNFWRTVKAEGGFLRVHVRGYDRAGDLHEQTAAVSIQPQLWSLTRLSPSDHLEDSSVELVQDREGQIFRRDQQSVAAVQRWNAATLAWEPLPQPRTALSNRLNVWTDGAGQLISQWSYWNEAHQTSEFYHFRWEAGAWQAPPAS